MVGSLEGTSTEVRSLLARGVIDIRQNLVFWQLGATMVNFLTILAMLKRGELWGHPDRKLVTA